MLRELSENLNGINKDRLEMKDTATETKSNFQRINSIVDEAKTKISSLEYKEA